MKIPKQFSGQLSIREQIVYALSVLQTATTDEVAVELIEWQGAAAKDAVRELTIETSHEMKKMVEDGIIKKYSNEENTISYCLKSNTSGL